MYDPWDETADGLFASLVGILREVPEGLAKRSLAELFEREALLELLLGKEGMAEVDPERAERLLAERWDEIESLRNERAASFLHSIQTNEF